MTISSNAQRPLAQGVDRGRPNERDADLSWEHLWTIPPPTTQATMSGRPFENATLCETIAQSA